MERLPEVIAQLPSLVSDGLLDFSGGSIGIRSDKGLFISPEGSGYALGWDLSFEDFVLFPGGGEASMATAGRRPHRLNRLHRQAFNGFPQWNVTVESMSPGLLAFALAGRELELSAHQAAALGYQRSLSVACCDLAADSADPETEAVYLIRERFSKGGRGAVLLQGIGLFAGAEELAELRLLVLLLEKNAQALFWQLAG